LRELAVSQRAIQMERDLWILLQSVSPKQAAIWIADKLDAMHDPEFRAIYTSYDAAYDWSPDDPRLHELAERTEQWLANRPSHIEGTPRPILDPTIAELVATKAMPPSPAWNRLTEIAAQR
ncbi:MAG TPA: hypothetical protein VHN80_17895, partial [Kineosporiaceae bacterium]|nr:hypothetical protein [Kineosporiaceae bacterium]